MRETATDSPRGPLSLTGTWTVLQCYHRQEKVTAQDLGRIGVGCYLPLIENIDRWKRLSLRPLIPGYVFCCARDELQFTRSIDLPGVYGWIPVADQKRHASELHDLFIGIDSRSRFEPLGHDVPSGEQCEVVGGPFKGWRGIVIDDGNKAQIVLQVSLLGQSIALEVDRQLCQRIV